MVQMIYRRALTGGIFEPAAFFITVQMLKNT